MASTRFHNDICRVQKQNEILTGLGRYMLNVPGNGKHPYYFEDPYIRLQKWGGNLDANPVELESELMGLGVTLGCDSSQSPIKYQPVKYPTIQEVTSQPRATHPAWEARTVVNLSPTEDPDYKPVVNPPFSSQSNTRLVASDKFESGQMY